MLASTTSERASVYVRYVRVQEREYRTFYRLIFLRVYSHATGPLAVLSLQLPVLCRRHLLTAFAWVGLYGELY